MGRGFKHVNTFSPNDSNTVCDVTGFKVKRSQVLRRWEGFYTIDKGWHPRQPQDTPIIPDRKRHTKTFEHKQKTKQQPIQLHQFRGLNVYKRNLYL